MDKPDVRALAEDVPAEVKALAEQIANATCSHQTVLWYSVRHSAAMTIWHDRATRETAKAEAVCAKNARTDATALQQAADSLLHADAAAWKKGFPADDALVRHIAQARFQIGRVLQRVAPAKNESDGWQLMIASCREDVCSSPPCRCAGRIDGVLAAAKAEGRRQGLEEAALLARRCFDDPEAEADPDYVAPAIRAIAQKAEG